MKIAYRIITPILSLGAIVMGLLLKLFYFAIGGATEELSSIVQLVQQFGVTTQFEYSAIEIIQLLMGIEPSAEEGSATFMTVAEPILPHLIVFVVLFVIALLLFLAVAGVSAATGNRKAVMGICISGLVVMFIAIIVSRLAFDKIIGGEIELSELVGMVSESAWAQVLATVVTVSTAILSAGYYAVFGMYILVILWTVLTNMLIKTPIQFEKKHRRRKPLKRPSAYFQK